MKWNEMESNGMEWNRMEWNGIPPQHYAREDIISKTT
jgi:hypothetical protein